MRDYQELYHYLMDDFPILYSQNLRKEDFVAKTETQSRTKKGKREYLNDAETKDLMKNLNRYFESKVGIP